MSGTTRSRIVALLVGVTLLAGACSSGGSTTDIAAPADPTPTATVELPSLVPAPSPTPIVVPTIGATAGQPTATPTADTGDATPDPTATATAAPRPTSTPRPIPTVAPTVAPTATPRPAQPTATAVPPTPVPTAWVNPDCYVGPGAADEPAWWCGGTLCWPSSPHAGCPTTRPVFPNVEVGCTISDRSIVVDEVIVLKAFQDPVNVPLVFSFEHGDGTIDRTAESYAYYQAPGHYDVVMNWFYGLQQGRVFCGTVTVTANGGPTPTPTVPATVQIDCTVSDRDIVVGQIITLQATQDPANVPVAYVFEHGDGTLDPTAQSQAYYQAPGIYAVALQWAHSGESGVIGCGTVNVSPNVDVSSFLGRSAASAQALAAQHGLTYRLVRLDDQVFPGTADFRLDRINIEIDAGVVTKATLG